jgi:general secretion pathway protein B
VSYILDALKKSDKERQRDEIPDLQAEHSPPPVRREERKIRSWGLPGVVGLVLLCGIALLWWQLGSEEKVQPVVAETQSAIPAPAPVQEVLVPETEMTPATSVDFVSEEREQTPKKADKAVVRTPVTPSSIPAGVAEKKPVPEMKAAVPAPAVQAEPVILLMEELPVAIRAGIPDLSFAGHVYSDVPQQRLIIINNRIVREGDLIANGLCLEKIDLEGVVLRYNRTVFRVKLF